MWPLIISRAPSQSLLQVLPGLPGIVGGTPVRTESAWAPSIARLGSRNTEPGTASVGGRVVKSPAAMLFL